MNGITTTLDLQLLPWEMRPMISVIGSITRGTLYLTTPEGAQICFGDGCEPIARMRLRCWSALRRIFRNGDIGLAECYRDGLIETESMTKLFRLGIQNHQQLEKAIHGNRLLNLGYRLRHFLRRNSRRGSARNIQAHYDLGNDFYRLWLDESMTYSSACFVNGFQEDLSLAQQTKYRRMLELVAASPGDRVLEIGSGWGGLAEQAALRGIRVHGVTLSQAQLEYARARIADQDLSNLVSFDLRDYRELNGRYDAVVSIEMLEAVGEQYWQHYFSKLNRLLVPGGKAALQSIVIHDDQFESYRRGTDFIQQYIFPGGMLPSPQAIEALALANGFRLGNIERFGKDYAETLRRWRRRFEQNLPAIRDLGFDESFIRLWRLYLCYCEAGFEEQRIDVLQLQLIKEHEA